MKQYDRRRRGAGIVRFEKKAMDILCVGIAWIYLGTWKSQASAHARRHGKYCRRKKYNPNTPAHCIPTCGIFRRSLLVAVGLVDMWLRYRPCPSYPRVTHASRPRAVLESQRINAGVRCRKSRPIRQSPVPRRSRALAIRQDWRRLQLEYSIDLTRGHRPILPAIPIRCEPAANFSSLSPAAFALCSK